MYLARTSMTNRSQLRSSTNCSPESTAVGGFDSARRCLTAPFADAHSARIALLAAYFVVTRRREACRLPPPQQYGARSAV
jgi:hypothetical protein